MDLIGSSYSFFTYVLALYTDGLSLLNECGNLRVFFPRSSFVTNTTLTHTNSPPTYNGVATSHNHIVCYGGDTTMAQVKWHNSNGPLEDCGAPCQACGGKCKRNGGVGEDQPVNGRSDIHLFNTSLTHLHM